MTTLATGQGKRRKWRAFTLIELLVVIGIIALLAGLLVPTVRTVMRRAEISRAKADVQRIVAAWESYYREYGVWPVENGNLFERGGGTNRQDAQEGTSPGMQMLVAVMTNIMYPRAEYGWGGSLEINRHPIATNYNPKMIPFMEYDPECLNEHGDMVDPWGNVYWFMFDLNQDGKVERGGPAATTVYASVIAWSLGPDGSNSEDDVKSWE
ncbi:MAG TPA: prepilin-type N-terminal cleavage/methylation domain-containing protein [Lentisphaerae bacterium]|nr:prepilin-type N-terminal cleavage/methylation domain-containing protein [Lentisphaerota bacterium]